MKRSLTTQADVEGAWLVEALDGIKALKRVWGKPFGVRFLKEKVEVLFKNKNCLALHAPAGVHNWFALELDLRDALRVRDWLDSGPIPTYNDIARFAIKGARHDSR